MERLSFRLCVAVVVVAIVAVGAAVVVVAAAAGSGAGVLSDCCCWCYHLVPVQGSNSIDICVCAVGDESGSLGFCYLVLVQLNFTGTKTLHDPDSANRIHQFRKEDPKGKRPNISEMASSLLIVSPAP